PPPRPTLFPYTTLFRSDGLDEELRLRREALTDEEEETRGKAIESQLADLTYLRSFGLPLIERLDALPQQAPWGEWLTHLRRYVRDRKSTRLNSSHVAIS